MNQAILCKCNTVLFKSVDGGSIKLSAKVIIFKDDKAFAVCKGCDSEIQVPLVVDEVMMKSMAANSNIKLFVKK